MLHKSNNGQILQKYGILLSFCIQAGYSNIYYKTDNADAELSYIEQALNQETPKLSVKEMQKMFDDEGIEPGPSSDTIGVIYRVGQIMMESQDYRLAKDCFSIVYDITQEEQLEKLLEELENV